MNVLLPVGVASVGAVLGLMVGASATPVVSVAVPTVFALAAAAIGLVQTSRLNKEVAETIEILRKDSKNSVEAQRLLRELRGASNRLGILLLAFSAFYLAGVLAGAKARVSNWLTDVAVAPPLPWALSRTKPPGIEVAVEWIALQHKLRKLGYDNAAIGLLYDIQVKEWQRSELPAPRPPVVSPVQRPRSRASGQSRPPAPALPASSVALPASNPARAASPNAIAKAPAASAPDAKTTPALSAPLDKLIDKPIGPLADDAEIRRKQFENKV